MRDVVTILKMIVRLGVRMLQRQARNAVGWFQQLMDSKWSNNIWIFNDSWVVPLKGFRFRGNYCSHLFTPSPRLLKHPKPDVVTMTEPFVRWETGKSHGMTPRVWSKSLAVLPAKRLRWKSVNTECSQCQCTKWSQQIAKRAAHRKQLVLSEPEQNEHRNLSRIQSFQQRLCNDTSNSLQNTGASLYSNSSKQFEFNSEQSSSSRSRACTKSSEKRANEWDYLWSCNSKLTMFTSRQKMKSKNLTGKTKRSKNKKRNRSQGWQKKVFLHRVVLRRFTKCYD